MKTVKTFGNVSESRSYVIVYGVKGLSAHAAIKIKLPSNLANNAKTAGYYIGKFLQPEESVLTVQAYEDLEFMEEIAALPYWNDVEDEGPHKAIVEAGEIEVDPTRNSGVEKFDTLGDYLKGDKSSE